MTVLVAAASEHGATDGDRSLDWRRASPRTGSTSTCGSSTRSTTSSATTRSCWGAPSTSGSGSRQRAASSTTTQTISRSRPTWLFSSGPIVGDPPPPDDPAAVQAALVERLVETTHARDHKVFGGKLDKSNLNWCEKIAVRCAHASEGDHRDRAAVDEWAAKIARELEQLAPQSRRIPHPHRVRDDAVKGGEMPTTSHAVEPKAALPVGEEPVVCTEHLSKRFGDLVAVDDLSFALERGTVTGFLGPNGAGKTTTLRMLLHLVQPTAGRALVFGRRYQDLERSAAQVGAVLEAADFHPGRSGRDHLFALALALGPERTAITGSSAGSALQPSVSTRCSTWSSSAPPADVVSAATRSGCGSGSALRARSSATPSC